GGRHQSMGVLDHRREVERREQLAVAEWPMLAAAEARSGDPDDAAEDDEQIGERGRGPREPGESRHGGRNVYSGRACPPPRRLPPLPPPRRLPTAGATGCLASSGCGAPWRSSSARPSAAGFFGLLLSSPGRCPTRCRCSA